jgi:hypothetical protein
VLNFRLILAVVLATALLLAFVAPVLAVEYVPGVAAKQYVLYNFYSLHGEGGYDWMKIEVTAVEGKEVTLLTTGKFANDTDLPNTGVTKYNVETGEENEPHSDLPNVIAANLKQGDRIPSLTSNFVINRTEVRLFMGSVHRVVNVLSLESSDATSYARVTLVYDAVSGIMLETENWFTIYHEGVELRSNAVRYYVVNTNIFQVPSGPLPVEYLYAVAAIAAVTVIPTTAVVLKRKRRPDSKTEMLEEKVRDLTYNLSGVNRGESYVSDSLDNSLRIASDLHTRGVSTICIVREDPELVVKKYNLKPEDVILLSSKPVKGFKAVDGLQEIAIAVTKFLKAGGGVVLMDGLEYLISRFTFNTVYRCLQEKRIEFMEAGAVLLLPFNMETLDNRERSQLLSELKLL